MADPLSLSTYGVKREFKFGGLTLDFIDGEGNQILKSQGKIAVTQQPIQTMDGKILGTVTHKILAMTPEYQLHEGGPKDKVIGVIKIPMQLLAAFASLNKIEIKGEDGSVIATANGNFMDMQFEINDSQGTAVANVSRNLGSNAGLLGKLSAFGSNSYLMTVIDNKNVPNLVLIGFLVVLELLLSKNQGSSPGLIGGGFGAGRGGFGIKM